MQVRFWGVRGSTPTPQRENMRFGGNTSCVEVRTDSDEILILDGGTGIRLLGQKLEEEFRGKPIRGHIFLSHFHLDHIQGIPFFRPLYDSQNHFTFYYAERDEPVVDAVAGIMATPYFPVDMSNLPCTRNYVSLAEGQLTLANARIDVRQLNHPQGSFGFRISNGSKTMAYCTDVELGTPWSDGNVRMLAADVDLLVVDSQFNPEELPAHLGWGHSSWRQAVEIGAASRARKVALFHYNPNHDDDSVEASLQSAKKFHPDVIAAWEGLELTI